MANFVASGVLRLGPKLGPILWQLPPNFRFDRDKLDAFFRLLPRDTSAAAALGRRHDHRLKARAWLRAGPRRHRLRHALEVRHDSFRDPAFIELLRRHDIALVCADTVEWPLLMDLTSDFVYCRLHGSRELYRSGYSAAELGRWARRIRAWRDGKAMRDGTFVGCAGEGHAARRLRLLRQHRQAHGAARRPGVDASPRGGLTCPPRQPLLKAVAKEAASCTLCPLYRNATQTVFGEGAARARIMLVGEQPGDQEDLAGHPFVGPAGKVLDRAMAEAGLDRRKV